eukprot:241796_1
MKLSILLVMTFALNSSKIRGSPPRKCNRFGTWMNQFWCPVQGSHAIMIEEFLRPARIISLPSVIELDPSKDPSPSTNVGLVSSNALAISFWNIGEQQCVW